MPSMLSLLAHRLGLGLGLGIVRVHQTNGVLRLDAHRPALPVHDPASKPSEPRWRFEPFHLHLVATPPDWQIAHENRPLAGHDFPLLSVRECSSMPRTREKLTRNPHFEIGTS